MTKIGDKKLEIFLKSYK